MDVAQALLLAAAGFLAGFCNTVAGGGSTFTIPALEWFTGSPGMANATNRVAILLQNVSATGAYQTGRVIPWKQTLRACPAAIAGGAAGAYLAAIVDPGVMRVALSVAILFVALNAVLRKQARAPKLHGAWRDVAFFFAGFYAGFMQIGVGFVLLAILVGGLALELVPANGMKVVIVLAATVPALLIFGLKGQVNWTAGAVVAAGNVTGAWIAARLAIKKGAGWIRYVLVFAAVAAVVKLLVFPSVIAPNG
ncbi:MAG: sulfite exporter TauE/SafE family protein [Planctomycetota bacterium]|nr:sulfite exporter TauE/SafE family protein [Planctomycetota bacterium]